MSNGKELLIVKYLALLLLLFISGVAAAAIGTSTSSPIQVDTESPEIDLHFPIPGDTLRSGEPVHFLWSIQEPNLAPEPALPIQLKIYDGGAVVAQWELPAQADDSYEFIWNEIGDIHTDDGYWEVSASDSYGNLASAISGPIVIFGSGVGVSDSQTPLLPSLSAYPNPFNPRVNLLLTMPVAGLAKLTIHDVSGRRVTELFNDLLPAGQHEWRWTPVNLAGGVYQVRFHSPAGTVKGKIVLLK